MVAAGRKMTRLLLPNAQPGDELEWARNGWARVAQLPPPKPPQGDSKKPRRRKMFPARHPLLDGAKELMIEGNVSDEGLLKPRKRLLVDIITSKQTLDRALDVANELFLSMERWGHSVIIEQFGQDLRRYAVDEREKGGRQRNYSDLWCPSRSTLVFIGTVAFGLIIFEMSENVEVEYQDGKYTRVSELPIKKLRRNPYSWTSTRDLPSGRLCVQAYSPYPRAAWMRQWREKKSGDFPRKLSGMVKELEAETATIARLVEEGERKAEIERQKREAEHLEWLREREEQRRIQAKKESREELLNIVDAWTLAKRIEDFFADAERRAGELGNDEKKMILERLKLGREVLGGTDALRRFRSWRAPDER
jgi:hypothetical protein